MQPLQFDQGENMGGTCALRFQAPSAFAVLGEAGVENTVQLNDIFSGSNDWITATITEGTGEFTEPEKREKGGPLWRCRWRGFYPGDGVSDRATLEEAARTHLVADVTDANGLQRRMGTRRNPARMSIEYGTAQQAAGRRGTWITLTWNNTRPAPELDQDGDSAS